MSTENRGQPSTTGDGDLVSWDSPADPANPQCWSNTKKNIITFTYGLVTLIVTLSSSIFSSAVTVTSEEYHVSTAVMNLGTALNVLGFAFGPLVIGPLSEVYGRKWPLIAGMLLFCVFTIPVATAQNLQTIMVCRFLVGFGGAAPLAIVGGGLVDLFPPIPRGVAVAVFAGATFLGSIIGPVVGGFVTQSSLGWRWTQWLTLIPGALLLALIVIFMPETHAPTILKHRARQLRFETGNWSLHTKTEETRIEAIDIVNRYLLRPVIMIFREPILALVTAYMSLIYGILYLFFEAYPISFNEERGWSLGLGALPFFSLGIGVLCGMGLIIAHNKIRYAQIVAEKGKAPPEERLIPMMAGAMILPIGLFWFAWTSSPNISWIPQVISGIFTGFGVMAIFIQGLSYIIDTYGPVASSAAAANVFIRSWIGAGFSMFATDMFHNLGVPWATSLLAFLCCALIPVPIVFFIYGANIRRRSYYSHFEATL